MRDLDQNDAHHAVLGGLLLSAGGSGPKSAQRHIVQGEYALARGKVALATVDEFDPEELVLTSTGVGAPGLHAAKLEPLDYVRAAQAVMAVTGQRPAAVMCGHAPGMSAWVVASALGIPLLDLAANGRAHPTVKLGGMGLASQPDKVIVQAACGGAQSGTARLEATARGNLLQTSRLMRLAATEAGGVVASARGMLSVGFCKRHGAVGAVSYALEMGRVLAADAGSRMGGLLAFSAGELLGIGPVTRNSVHYADGFTRGQIVVETAHGPLVLHVFNEHMAVDVGGVRISTFPDLIASVNRDCEALAIQEMPVGTEVAIVRIPQDRLLLGSGVWDASAYPEIEEALGISIAPKMPVPAKS